MITLTRILGLLLGVLGPQSGSPPEDIPTPLSVLGHEVGADLELANYDETLRYFQALDAASDRVQLVKVGKSSHGLPWYLALVSSPQNLRDFEHYREVAQRLAHPRELTDSEARDLSRHGKALVHIDGALHSTESATSQFPIQLAYDLAVAEGDPELDAILRDTILILWFSINPDGHNMMANWYRSNLGRPFEVAPMVELYQKYIGHDNNRDGYMLNMVESRVITRTIRHLAPHILYNHHQTAPFPTRIWIPPFAEPVSSHVHPLMWRQVNTIGMAMSQALEERGMKGATHMGTGFDNWYPGFMDHANNFHNVVSFLTETALFRYATPKFYTVSDFPRDQRGLRPSSLYSSPWEGGWWRIRDAVDYMVEVSIAVLDYAAKYKNDLLYNRYQAGRDVIRRFEEEPPYAYFIAQDQRDPMAAVEMLRRLAFNGVEIYSLTRAIEHDGLTHGAGTWVIPMDQEFALFVRQLFGVQSYPDLRAFPEGPPDNPYDVAGWTLPYQMDVRVVEARSPLSEELRQSMLRAEGPVVQWEDEPADASALDSVRGAGFDTHPVAAGIVPPAGVAEGSGAILELDMAQNNSYRALRRAWQVGGEVRFEPAAIPGDGSPGPSGKYVVQGVPRAEWTQWVAELGLRAKARSETSSGVPVTAPRIGLYRPWTASMDEGWTRWCLERFGLEPMALRNADVRAGRLQERFDVIVLASMRGGSILNGHSKGSVPPRYAGGIGMEGVRAMDEFIRSGGTLVCLNSSCSFAIDQLHLPVEIVTKGLKAEQYFAAGSLLAVHCDPAHPLMTGMPETAKIFMSRSPVFTTKDEFIGSVLAKYQKAGSPLLSGYLVGEEHLQGYAAALDVHHGKGHVVLMGFQPQWRGQPFGTFRALFNACLYHGPLPRPDVPNPKFWERPPEAEKNKAAEKQAEDQR